MDWGERRQSPAKGLALVTAGEVSSASCEETRVSHGVTAAGRESGMDRAGTSEGGSASWQLTGVRRR